MTVTTRPRIGEPMRHFSLPGTDGPVSTDALVGRGPLVIYFYPRDDTPGCTAEACAFRDESAAIEEARATILGISPDTIESHRAFAAKHRLPFALLADPHKQVFRLYGVTNDLLGLMTGRETFVADATGIVRVHVDSVDAQKHIRAVCLAIRDPGLRPR